jgi:hypothetical protein
MASFSVIVPTFNRPAQLGEALTSIAGQRHIDLADVEVIVVNDGGCPVQEVIDQARLGGLRVESFSHGQNRGLPAARNTGLDHATGTYLCFLDDDDVFLPDHLATVAPVLDSGANIVTTQCLMVDQRWRPGQPVPPIVGRWNVGLTGLLSVLNTIPVHSAALRREIAPRFDETLGLLEDWDYWLRATSGDPVCRHLDAATVIYHIAPTGTMIADTTAGVVALTRLVDTYVRIWQRQPAPTAATSTHRAFLMAAYAIVYARVVTGQPINPHYYQQTVDAFARSWDQELDPTMLHAVVDLVRGDLQRI